ncbi:MAG: hypothetical protein ACYTF6_09035 [Planctomycetota bacterium]|jgi:hypothetical protein
MQPVELDLSAGVEPSADYTNLAAVLEEAFVTKRRIRRHRFIDTDAVVSLAGRLDSQLKLLAVSGPTATPELFTTDDGRIAYWYNARAAWALKLAMLYDFRRKLSPRQFYTRRFPLDGRQMSLERIDAVLAKDGDWRTLAAAPCMTLQRAHLPPRPFGSADIRHRIATRIGEFIDDDERFVIDVRQKLIRVPPVLWRFEAKLRAAHCAAYGTTGCTLTTALLHYVAGSPHRRLQDAVGYVCAPARPAHDLALEEK